MWITVAITIISTLAALIALIEWRTGLVSDIWKYEVKEKMTKWIYEKKKNKNKWNRENNNAND